MYSGIRFKYIDTSDWWMATGTRQLVALIADWWLVAGDWWLVAGDWLLVGGGWWLVASGSWLVAAADRRVFETNSSFRVGCRTVGKV